MNSSLLRGVKVSVAVIDKLSRIGHVARVDGQTVITFITHKQQTTSLTNLLSAIVKVPSAIAARPYPQEWYTGQ